MFDKDMLARLRAARKKWESGRHKKAPDSPGEREMFSELPKKPLYTPEALAEELDNVVAKFEEEMDKAAQS